MTRVVLAALLGHWRRHPFQIVTLLLGLALGTALWTGVQAINAEARASYAQAASTLGGGNLDRLVDPTGALIPQSVYVALRRAGVAVSPLVEGRLRGIDRGLSIRGIEPLSAPPAMQVADLSDPDDLAAFLAGRAYAAAENVGAARAALPGPVLPAAGLAPGQVVMDIGAAQRVLAMPDQVTALVLSPGAVIPDGIAPGLIRQAAGGRSDMAGLTDSFHLNLTAFGLLSFAVGLFIAHGAVGLAFEQRQGVFRTLRALGVPPGQLARVYAVELGALALTGAVLGLGLGYALAAALLPNVAGALDSLYGASLSQSLSLRWSWMVSGVAVCLVGAGVSGAQRVLRLAAMPAMAAPRPQALRAQTARLLRWQAGAALGLLALSAGLAAMAGTVVAGFLAIGTLFIGAALGLIPVLSPVLDWAAHRAKAPLAQWFWADTRQQTGALSLALMALLLALATNIGVSTMVSSFRDTFIGWLDQRLMAELYLTARSEDEAMRLRAFLGPRTDAVLPIRSVDLTDLPAGVEVFAVADHPTYRDHWPLMTARGDVWAQVAAGTGALVNEQMFRKQALALGDMAALPGGGLPIVGVYTDYGNPRPQVMIGTAAFAARFPHAPDLRMALRLPADRVAELMDALENGFDLPASAMIDQVRVKRLSRQVFEQTFAVTGALTVLTLGVAAIAIWTSLQTLAAQRGRQLAPVWAQGVPRRRLAALDLLRSLVLAGLVFGAALPLGLALGWMLLNVVNVAAFGWRLPMSVFPADWAGLFASAMAAAGLAAILPALHLARTNPADLLKVFAHDR